MRRAVTEHSEGDVVLCGCGVRGLQLTSRQGSWAEVSRCESRMPESIPFVLPDLFGWVPKFSFNEKHDTGGYWKRIPAPIQSNNNTPWAIPDHWIWISDQPRTQPAPHKRSLRDELPAELLECAWHAVHSAAPASENERVHGDIWADVQPLHTPPSKSTGVAVPSCRHNAGVAKDTGVVVARSGSV